MSRSEQFTLCIGCRAGGAENVGQEDEPLGRIVIADFVEHFRTDLCFWSKQDYWRSWLAAIEVLEEQGHAASCLVTSIADPGSSHVAMCWPLYREGERVFVQNAMIIFDDLPVPFDIDRPWLSIQPHTTVDEDGNRISEWSTDMESVREFGRRIAAHVNHPECLCEPGS
ncbi:hypothetical protein ACIQV3_32530 [Streptomyces sp. NPDC099050]|uniref:hypothetical protein n=1 Tax=Streptomyces sp. NPDC099050 TaxID=3366100 RepID=UPI00382AC059